MTESVVKLLETKNHWFGFWASDEDDEEDCDELPTIEDAISTQWSIEDKEHILDYMRNSPIVFSSMSLRTCWLCPLDVDAFCFCSDGDWIWPRSMIHEVEKHFVVLPTEFVRDVREKKYTPPLDQTMSNRKLLTFPWPNCWRNYLERLVSQKQ